MNLNFSIRWLFAIATVICGIFVLFKSDGSDLAIATGIGLVTAGVGLVAP